jgi:hypothetical protein
VVLPFGLQLRAGRTRLIQPIIELPLLALESRYLIACLGQLLARVSGLGLLLPEILLYGDAFGLVDGKLSVGALKLTLPALEGGLQSLSIEFSVAKALGEEAILPTQQGPQYEDAYEGDDGHREGGNREYQRRNRHWSNREGNSWKRNPRNTSIRAYGRGSTAVKFCGWAGGRIGA